MAWKDNFFNKQSSSFWPRWDYTPHFEKLWELEYGLKTGRWRKKKVCEESKQKTGKEEKETALCLSVWKQPVRKGFDSECSGKKMRSRKLDIT